MLNDSVIVKQLQGEYFSVKPSPLVFDKKIYTAMGYVPVNGFEELVKLILWDGAGSRASLGGNVGLEVPANRYQDGVRLEVVDYAEFCIGLMSLEVIDWRRLYCSAE